MSRSAAGLRVLVAYLVALAAGGVALLVPHWKPLAPWGLPHTLVALFVADLVATLVIFGFSLVYRNASFYDAYWSVLPPLFVGWWLWVPGDGVLVRQVLVGVGVLLWAVRLTANWWRGWTGLDHEDWRYGMLREQTGAFYPLVNLFGIHVFPTIQVFLGGLPLAYALAWGSQGLGVLDVVAAVVLFGAVGFNHVADEQLRAFRRAGHPRETVLDTGLWAWSRHPNYVGEMGFWWGVWLFGLASAGSAAGWTVVGAVAISAMFWGVSIPMIEKRMLERRPTYASVQKRVSMVVPLPPRQ